LFWRLLPYRPRPRQYVACLYQLLLLLVCRAAVRAFMYAWRLH
jgi:hypothetical protein